MRSGEVLVDDAPLGAAADEDVAAAATYPAAAAELDRPVEARYRRAPEHLHAGLGDVVADAGGLAQVVLECLLQRRPAGDARVAGRREADKARPEGRQQRSQPAAVPFDFAQGLRFAPRSRSLAGVLGEGSGAGRRS